MTKKVKLAIFDRDLKAREYKHFDVTDDGSKIRVRSGGKRNFNPTFDNDSFIEFPRPRYLGGGWDRVYFARNGAKACVRFRRSPNDLSSKIDGIADLQEVMKAAENGNLEAQHEVMEILNVLRTATADDFLIPDPEQVRNAAQSDLISNFGKEKQETSWQMWAILGLNLFILLIVMGVINV
jgi:hypothetical protein